MPYGIFLFSSYWDCKTLKQKFIGKSTLQHFIRFCFQYALFIQKSGFQAYVVLFDQSCSIIFSPVQSRCSANVQLAKQELQQYFFFDNQLASDFFTVTFSPISLFSLILIPINNNISYFLFLFSILVVKFPLIFSL